MVEKFFRRRQALALVLSTPAGPYLNDLATELVQQGYGRWKIRQRLHGAAHFSFWIVRKRVALHDAHERVIPGFRVHLKICRCPGRWCRSRHSDVSAIAGAELLIKHLRRLGVVASPAPQQTRAEVPSLIQDYGRWVSRHRGIADGTLRGYRVVICDALNILGQVPSQYTAQSIRAYILKRSVGASRSSAKQLLTAMRSFLRFLIAEGRCRPGLDGAIPIMAMWRLASLPRYLAAAEVNRIIEGCDPRTAVGLRDQAVLLLLSRLGLRAGDIRTLRLADLDWQQASIRVSGKSRTETRLPLTQEVGDALSEYLERGRPPVSADQVFVRMQAPWGPLKASSVSAVVQRAMSRVGIDAPSRGAHILRHSAATEMLRQGATLDQIGTVLRHRYLDTTALYAKVDVRRLRQVALPWPEVVPC